MATPINLSPSLEQGFAWQPADEQTVGYLYTFTVGDKALQNDWHLAEPTQPASTTTPLVGVISSLSWGGAQDEPLNMTAHISAGNRVLIDLYLRVDAVQPNSSKALAFTFRVFAYDVMQRKYFPAFRSESMLRTVLGTAGGAPQLSVPSTAEPRLTNPVNYAMSFVAAQPLATQDLYVQQDASSETLCPWGGVSVASGGTFSGSSGTGAAPGGQTGSTT